MESLPSDVIREIAIKLSYEDLRDYCKTNKKYGNVCKDQRFWVAKIRYDFGENAPLLENDGHLSYLRLVARERWNKVIELYETDFEGAGFYDALEQYNDLRNYIREQINPDLPRIEHSYAVLGPLLKLIHDTTEDQRYEAARMEFHLPELQNGDLIVFEDLRKSGYDTEPNWIAYVWSENNNPNDLRLEIYERSKVKYMPDKMKAYVEQHNLPRNSYDLTL